MICITFGQPPIDIPYVQETINNNPKFENTIHSIYDQEDIFPKLLRNKYKNLTKIIEQRTSVKALTSGNGHHSPSTAQKLLVFPSATEANVSVIMISCYVHAVAY